MKLTNQQLINSAEALNALRDLKLPRSKAQVLGLAIHKLEPIFRTHAEQVEQIQKDHKLPEKPAETASAEEKAAYAKAVEAVVEAQNKELAELNKAEHEIEQKALPLTVLTDREGNEIEIDVKYMQALWWLFEEPAPAG